METVLIIGAGPAGLTAAWRLLRDGKNRYKPIIVETSDFIGGIACTVEYKGNYMDMGGHRFFTKNEEVQNAWLDFQPNPFRKRTRISRIYFQRKFFDYPITLTLKTIVSLGFSQTMSAGLSYLKALLIKRPEHSLEDFYINRFGKVLYQLFFERYTEKLWGTHPRDLSPDWGAQRVKGLSLRRAIIAFLATPFKRDDARTETSLIDWFYYPRLGPGQYWEQMAQSIVEKGGEIRLSSEVIGLGTTECDGRIFIKSAIIREVKTGDIYRIEPDAVISSMPIKDLIAALGKVAPERVREIAEALPYRDFMTVGLLVNKLVLSADDGGLIPDSWIYVQEPEVKLGRIQIFNNWSQDMVASPDDTVWLGLEYFCAESDEMWNARDEDFIAFAASELAQIGVITREDVLDGTVVRVKKAYPSYFGSYEHFGEVKDYLKTIDNLYCVGRNGQHRYNNMDHSMLTSFEAVRAILDPAYDKDRLWEVNTEQTYSEELSDKEIQVLK